VQGFNDAKGHPILPFQSLDAPEFASAFPDGAIWPAEFQNRFIFTRKGRIQHWDADPEFREGDLWPGGLMIRGTSGLPAFHY
jgi:hypothetical protein